MFFPLSFLLASLCQGPIDREVDLSSERNIKNLGREVGATFLSNKPQYKEIGEKAKEKA